MRARVGKVDVLGWNKSYYRWTAFFSGRGGGEQVKDIGTMATDATGGGTAG